MATKMSLPFDQQKTSKQDDEFSVNFSASVFTKFKRFFLFTGVLFKFFFSFVRSFAFFAFEAAFSFCKFSAFGFGAFFAFFFAPFKRFFRFNPREANENSVSGDISGTTGTRQERAPRHQFTNQVIHQA